MRISYWSSDVCSFRSNGARRAVIDVAVPIAARNPTRVKFESSQLQGFVIPCHTASITLTYNECTSRLVHPRQPSRQQRFQHASQPPDRQSVVSGKSVSESVALGGRRIIKKKKKK